MNHSSHSPDTIRPPATPVRVGIIGCGARMRAVAGNLLKTDAASAGLITVTALADPSPPMMERMRRELRLDAELYPDSDTLLQKAGVDWVMIGSWNNVHADQAVAALQAGKRVFCEKPLATTLTDCLRMRHALRDAEAGDPVKGRRFFFGLVLRYTSLYRRVRELLDAGTIGRLISFEFNETLGFNHGGYIHGNWRRHRDRAGTHLLEKCCHDFDIVNWLTGSLPVRAASFGGRDFFRPGNRHFAERLGSDKDGKPAYRTWENAVPEDPFSEGASIVDNQVVILEYASGARATFHTNCNAALTERRLYLLGAEGSLRADACTGLIEYKKIGFDTKPVIIDLNRETGLGHYGGDDHMARQLALAMTEGAPPLATLDDGLRAAVSCFGVDEAQDTGRVFDYTPLWADAGIRTA
ncbi:putative dehydrogenase [Opitutaceae bacterium TAV1]|nr:putative dehydrogenase [Opitutaceae bacterium TAV1]